MKYLIVLILPHCCSSDTTAGNQRMVETAWGTPNQQTSQTGLQIERVRLKCLGLPDDLAVLPKDKK